MQQLKKISRFVQVAILACLFYLIPASIHAQAECDSFKLTAVNAFCVNQGKINIDTTGIGGVKPYQFAITGGGSGFTTNFQQNTPITAIPGSPNPYNVTFKDANGVTCTKSVTVLATYIPLSNVQLVTNGCNMTVNVTGGGAPFNYEVFTSNPSSGSPPLFTKTDSLSTLIFKKLGNSTTYWVRVTDICGGTFPAASALVSYSPLNLSATMVGTTGVTATLNGYAGNSLFTYKLYNGGVLKDTKTTTDMKFFKYRDGVR
jgi:hypothetical protein